MREDRIEEINREVYRGAYNYLLKILPAPLKERDLEKYFVGDSAEFDSLKDVYIQIIRSAQNYQRMPNVIKFEEQFNEIGKILHDYDYKKISAMSVNDLYYKFRNKLHITTKDSKRNSWYKWSNSVIDAAKFVDNFKDVADFKKFVDLYSYNTVTRMSLPLLISSKISGIGFALACDLLKELGYLNYPKPDVHMIDIFSQLGLSNKNPINVFEAVVKMADDCNVMPYKVDKVLWLISSGRFYLDNITINRHKEDFLVDMKNILGQG